MDQFTDSEVRLMWRLCKIKEQKVKQSPDAHASFDLYSLQMIIKHLSDELKVREIVNRNLKNA